MNFRKLSALKAISFTTVTTKPVNAKSLTRTRGILFCTRVWSVGECNDYFAGFLSL